MLKIKEIIKRIATIQNAPPRVYSNYERMPIDGEGGQGVPTIQEINQIVPPLISNTTPRYRGATSTPDLDNKGIVNGNRMNNGDYIMYTGVDNGDWLYAYIMQWNGREWERVSRPSQDPSRAWMYLDGISNLTAGAPAGVFSDIFVETIAANTAFIRHLFAELITLNQNGGIKSENYKEGTSGFLLPANGKAVFNDEVFIYNLKVVSFEIIPPSSSGILIVEMIGYQTRNIILGIGWYRAELAGGGGGWGGSGTPEGGGDGGNGGYLSHLFYNNYSNTTAILVSGNGGGNGTKMSYFNDYVGSGGGGGGGSILEISNLNLNLYAGGGGGGGGGASSRYYGGGGGGGGIGRGGNGGGSANGGAGDSIRVGGDGGYFEYGGGGGGIGYINVGGNGGRGGESSDRDRHGHNGYSGGTSVNGYIVPNAGGVNNSNGGAGYIRLYKLS